MTPFELLAALVTGFAVGVASLIAFAKWADANKDRLEKDLKERTGVLNKEPEVMRLAIEEHHGIFYVFNAETGAFVCQGRDTEEVQAVFKSRFPTAFGVIVSVKESILETLKKQGMAVSEE